MTTVLEPHDIREFLAEQLQFPIDVEHVIAEIGDVKIEAPDIGRSERIGDLLDGVERDSYDSPDELDQMIHSMLPDEYIGRKYYDDRGEERTEHQVQRDDEDQSF